MIELMADGDVAFVRVHASLTAGLASGLRDALGWPVEHHVGVVVNLGSAPTSDPVCLGVLVSAQRRAQARQEAVCLVGPPRFVRAVLPTMRVTRLFPVFDNTTAARARLRANVPAPAATSRSRP